MTALLKSRKFWLLILDTLISLGLYFTSKYFPASEADVKLVILTLQPVFIMIIGAIAYEDAAALKAGVHPSSPPATYQPRATSYDLRAKN